MLPDKPLLWSTTFIIVIFSTHLCLDFAMGNSESLLTLGFKSLITGFATIGLMFIVDEVRNRWFTEQ